MKVAVTSSDGRHINVHFGHANVFYIYDVGKVKSTLVDIRKTDRFCVKDSHHGKNNGVMEKFAGILGDCEILLCSSVGYHVAESLKQYGIHVYMLECGILTGLRACRENLLDRIMLV
jgi:predicted Fe-Mo cluster-binding NifX family protein